MTQRAYFKAACDPDSQSPQGIRLGARSSASGAILELNQRPFLADYDMYREMVIYTATV